MGDVDLNFKPRVSVFDANVALGRRHDRRVNGESVGETLEEMDRAGVDRALVYAPHAVAFDAPEGNAMLLEQIEGEPRLVPQFACNPSYDNIDSFARMASRAGVRTIRMTPRLHNYPFRNWMVGSWLDWAEATGVSIWLPTNYSTNWHRNVDIDPHEVFDTLKDRPGLQVVLCEVAYAHYPWAMGLLRSLPNLHIEISSFVIGDGIGRLLATVGDRRILYGSRFPESGMGPQLYNVHHQGLSEPALKAICAENLQRLVEER